jgi:DNA-binding transcriptional regulator GbsR (MarR family)
VTAGEELHREVLEVLHAAQDARKLGAKSETEAHQEIDEHATKLKKATARIEDLRAALWAPRTESGRIVDDIGPPVPASTL